MVGPIEEYLLETFFSAIFRGDEVEADFHKILVHSVKRGGLGIPDPQFSAESAYNTSKAACGEIVGSFLGVTSLDYVGHRACIRGVNSGLIK